jgi:hypothetical protein
MTKMGEHHAYLSSITKDDPHVRPVWRGKLTMSGKMAAVANLKSWAAMERDAASKAQSLDLEHCGGVRFGNGGMGNAHAPGGSVLATTGVVGNIVHVQAPNASEYVGIDRGNPESIFTLAGMALVGRRLQDPLHESLAGMHLRRAQTRLRNRRKAWLLGLRRAQADMKTLNEGTGNATGKQ